MTAWDLISRISPFRWRLEWLLLVIAAASLVLAEQAHEARQRDPYQIVHAGRSAQAIVRKAHESVVQLGIRRGVPQLEARTLIDLEWHDDTGGPRRVEGYRLDRETARALRVDVPAGVWPAHVRILYLDRPTTSDQRSPALAVVEQGVTAISFQQSCRPQAHCRLVVLPPDVLTPAEEATENVDYVLERAPHALALSIVVLLLLLALRLAGVIHNRPSLE